MKRFLFFILIGFQGLLICAQVEHDSNTVVYSWQLENNFSTPVEIPIDSVLDNFQTLLPIYKISTGNAFLSNFGSPFLPYVYSQRNYNSDFFFLNSYYPYLLYAANTTYYNTKSALSTLFYSKGGSDNNKEESFDAFVTQNLNSKFNFGLHYNLISAKSQYKYLNVKKNSFRIFASYTGIKYMMHSSFNINRLRNDENGGVIDSLFKEGKYRDIKQLPVRFIGSAYPSYTSNAVNRIRYCDLFVSQRLKLFTISAKIDSSDMQKKRSMAEPIVTHVLHISRSTKAYEHNPIASGFYDTIYFNPYKTYDSVANLRIFNTLQLEFKTTLRGKVQAGVYGLIGNEIDIYSQYCEIPDSITVAYDSARFNESVKLNNDFKDKFSNTFFKAGLYTNFWNRVKANFSGTIYFIGPKAGQTLLEGIFDTRVNILKNEFVFSIESQIENKYPSWLLENYTSNHYIWNQTLLPENKFVLSSKIGSSSKKFFIRGNYSVLRNHIYFNSEARPVNVDKDEILNYFSIEVTKTFKLWKLYCLNNFIYQVSGNQDIIPLPNIVLYNSTYFDHTFKFKSTNGEFRAMLGIDIFYNTLFKGYDYAPALAQFYPQGDITIGNYPLMDVFLNIQLKRIRFFLKLQHFNSQWFEQEYYSAVGYPYNQMQFKFGLSVILSN